jgi:peroxiredoxin
MKTRRPGLLALLILMMGVMAGLQARATKNNVGTRLPDLNLQFTEDAPKCGGQPLLIEFWATSCSSCRESVTHLNALYGKFKPRGLEALGVTEDDEATVKAFKKDFPISYAVGHDRRGRLASALGVVALPHAVLADKDGQIVWEGHPLNITESQLVELVR